MNDPPIIRIETAGGHGRRPVRKKWSWISAGLLCTAGLAIGLIGSVLYRVSQTRQPVSNLSQRDGTTATDSDATAENARQQVDRSSAPRSNIPLSLVTQQTLWEIPSTGTPIDLSYCPQGGQCFLFVRPHALLADEEGRRVLQALGPFWEGTRQTWEAKYGLEFEDVSELVMTFVPTEDGDVFSVTTLKLVQRLPPRWQEAFATAANVDGDSRVAELDGIPAIVIEQPSARIVLGPKEALMAIQRIGTTPPPLRRELEQLHAMTSSDRQVICLFVPSFVIRQGNTFLPLVLRGVEAFIDEHVTDATRAASFSAQLQSGSCYLEARLMPTLEARSDVRRRLTSGLNALPGEVEDLVIRLSPIDPYWARLAVRLPRMIQFAVDRVRVAEEKRQLVVNVVLPAKAAHNLVAGGECLLHASQSLATHRN